MFDNRSSFKRIHFVSTRDTAHLPAALYEALAISTANGVANNKLIPPARDLLAASLRLLRPGGIMAIDNTLWHDKVADPAQRDAETIAIRTVVNSIRDDERWLASLLPVGDGLLVAVRQSDD